MTLATHASYLCWMMMIMMMMMACPLCPPLSLSLGVKPRAFALRILGKSSTTTLYSKPLFFGSSFLLLLHLCFQFILISFLALSTAFFFYLTPSLSAQLSGMNEDLRPLIEKRNTTYGKVSILWFLA